MGKCFITESHTQHSVCVLEALVIFQVPGTIIRPWKYPEATELHPMEPSGSAGLAWMGQCSLSAGKQADQTTFLPLTAQLAITTRQRQAMVPGLSPTLYQAGKGLNH